MNQHTLPRSKAQSGNGRPTPEFEPYVTPRWVKVFGTVMTIVILSFVILRFTVFSGQ
jgi:hypothetical protein